MTGGGERQGVARLCNSFNLGHEYAEGRVGITQGGQEKGEGLDDSTQAAFAPAGKTTLLVLVSTCVLSSLLSLARRHARNTDDDERMGAGGR